VTALADAHVGAGALAAGEAPPPPPPSGPLGRLLDRMRGITGGVDAYPLLVLSLLFLVDEFDTTTFATNSPEIKKYFGLNDNRFGLLIAVNAVVVLALAVPLGYLGDRLRRVRVAVIGAVIAGICTVGTGLAPMVWVLVVFRLGNGAGRLVNTSIHNSLLSDTYAPDTRPKVLGFHRNAEFLGTILGFIVTGTMGHLIGWKLTFILIGIPITGIVALLTRLREPRRGSTDDPDSAEEAERTEPIGFWPSVRTLTSVKTLKRQYTAWLFIGAGAVPLAIYLPLLQERVFHLNPLERGMIGAANAGCTLVGVFVSSAWTQRWFALGMGEPLRRAGLCLALVGVGLLGVAATRTLILNVPIGLAASFSIGCFYPPLLSTQALTSPAQVRTMSFSFGALFLGLGGVIFLVFFGRVSDDHGVQWAIAATVPFWLIGGAVLASARPYVEGDAGKALRLMAIRLQERRRRADAGDRSMLVCAGVDAGYDSVQVLFEVDLDVQEGEIVALLGTNGAGKSTLLKAISGLLDPSGGLIVFDGTDVTHMNPIERARLGIVQMPGGRSVFPTLTVNECLRLAGWLHKGDPAHVAQATEKALEYFPVLRDRSGQMAGNLSGGEQQMLGLAMAFISKPRLLMIDELSLGLAPTVVAQLVEIVRAIHAQGTTVIVVEQSVNVALLLAQRAVFMEKGEVRFSGPTADLLERDDILRSVFLQGAASHTGDAPARTNERLALPPVEDDAPVILELDDVSVSFGGVRAVNGTSLTLRQGEILGLIGPNGAGKTTLFDLISGFVSPTHGRIRFHGTDITDDPPDKRARIGLGRSFQDARIFPSLTVVENLAVALERHLEVRDPIAASLALPAVAETEVAVRERVDQLVQLLGLGAFANKFAGELSTGSRRIVDLGMAIAHSPSVLLLDEPSSGIAQRETEALGPLLLRIQAELACSLLVIEHDMPLITSVSHTMCALELGTPIVTGTPAEVVENPRVIASYLGTNERVVQRSGDAGHALEEVFADLHEHDDDIGDEVFVPPVRTPRQPRVAARNGNGNGTASNGAVGSARSSGRTRKPTPR
jgi:ABC-type branched-subunit amino acid transport system ATPase component/MFS family permease